MGRACTGMILSSDENQKQKPLDRGLHPAAMTAFIYSTCFSDSLFHIDICSLFHYYSKNNNY